MIISVDKLVIFNAAIVFVLWTAAAFILGYWRGLYVAAKIMYERGIRARLK